MADTDTKTLERIARRKRRPLTVVVAALALIAALSAVRWTPPVDDWITGGFHPVRTLAIKYAQSVARSPFHPPVTVIECEECASQRLMVTSYAAPTRFLVVGYDEKLRAINLMLMEPVPPGGTGDPATELRLEPGRVDAMFGQPLTHPIQAVVSAYDLMFVPDYFIRALNWRLPDNEFVKPAAPEDVLMRRHTVNPQALPPFPGLQVTLPPDRVNAARQHNAINRLLLWPMALLGVVCVFAIWTLRAAYAEARGRFAAWGDVLTLPAFISGDFLQLGAEAERRHQIERQREAAQARTELIARRSRVAVRRKAEAFLRLPLPEDLRTRLQSALESDDFERMNTVTRDAEALVAERPPEQRLEALLEPLRDLCSAEQWQDYRSRANAIYKSGGFRQARDFVVSTHARLRAEADAAEDANAAAAL